ncbi:acyl-CoA N-acyltransferase [Absidia repens]|uniref:Acyl-CoA N-acyltransferase n=1 Tax=Absidia repens TaxID=90262 RepID=A0A1X2IVJ5_9FUNG|nr:acyl-CoA N-acyltransferase [Absidia repens]
MPTDNIPTYAMVRNEFVNWSKFANENQWATGALVKKSSSNVPGDCVAIYYVVDNDKKEILQKLFVTSWNKLYQPDFKKLNLHWVSTLFKVEASDVKQLEHPEETILAPGGQILFILEEDHNVAGTVSAVIHDGVCELGKMAVGDAYQGKGYAHPLMRECISWAKRQGYPDMTIYSNDSLVKAINLYKKYGFVTTHLGAHPRYERVNIIMSLKF